MNNDKFQIKMYCKILGIKYEDIENLTIEEQLEVIESSDREGYKIVEDTKKTLAKLLIKEKEENEKFEKDVAQAIKIVNEGHKKYNNNENER